MFEIPKFGVEYSQYDGSRMFTWLADICGLSVDLVSINYNKNKTTRNIFAYYYYCQSVLRLYSHNIKPLLFQCCMFVCVEGCVWNWYIRPQSVSLINRNIWNSKHFKLINNGISIGLLRNEKKSIHSKTKSIVS